MLPLLSDLWAEVFAIAPPGTGKTAIVPRVGFAYYCSTDYGRLLKERVVRLHLTSFSQRVVYVPEVSHLLSLFPGYTLVFCCAALPVVLSVRAAQESVLLMP